MHNNVPLNPGAYLINGNVSTNNNMYQIPIYSSIPSLTGMGFEDVDNTYYLLPGYKLERYDGINYATLVGSAIDNTNGTKIMLYQENTVIDRTASIKLYYKNIEIPSVYTYTLYANNSGSLTTTPLTPVTIGSYITTSVSMFPGAYLISSTGIGCMPIFYSIPDLTTFLNLTNKDEDCVLVLPGYKIIMWFGSNYTGTYVAIDNTTGSSIIVGQSSTMGAGGWDNNSVSSVKIYYNGNIINASDIIS